MFPSPPGSVRLTRLLAGAFDALKKLRRGDFFRRGSFVSVRSGEPDLPLGGNLAILKVDRAILEVQRPDVDMQAALFTLRARSQPGDELVQNSLVFISQTITVHEPDGAGLRVVDVFPVGAKPEP